jgi:hypothetical protein
LGGQKRRKMVFGARKQRFAGPEAAKFQGGTGEKGKKPKKVNFRAEHAKLIAQMRCVRAVPEDNNREGEPRQRSSSNRRTIG